MSLYWRLIVQDKQCGYMKPKALFYVLYPFWRIFQFVYGFIDVKTVSVLGNWNAAMLNVDIQRTLKKNR